MLRADSVAERLSIAVFSHIRHPVAEPFMGGMEAHCAGLVRALMRCGHRVTLFCAGECASDLPQVRIAERAYEACLPWAQWRGTPELAAYQRDAFRTGWDGVRAGGFDVVHNNSLFPDLIEWAHDARIPMVTSMHVPPFGELSRATRRAGGSAWAQFTVTSASQLPLWFDDVPPTMTVVHNGIDCSVWKPGAGRGAGAIWVGRITPNKGPHEAVAAARRAGVALDLYGAVEDADYFASAVAPLLGGEIAYRGHLSGAALRDRVAAARVMLVTPKWDEPFGLVAAEALACGVPVAAYDRGAMREVIGECGVVVADGDVEGLARGIEVAAAIDPAACRARAEEWFSVERMIAGYEACYDAAMVGARDSSSSSTRAELAKG